LKTLEEVAQLLTYVRLDSFWFVFANPVTGNYSDVVPINFYMINFVVPKACHNAGFCEFATLSDAYLKIVYFQALTVTVINYTKSLL
jgi:hypothetical protein